MYFLLAVTTLAPTTTLGQQEPCTKAQNSQAEDEADTFRNWDALYRSYRRFARCNDATAEEGYSESVARILVDHWETLNRLSQLSARDSVFRKFVLGHIDATLDMDDVARIRRNAIHRCPSSL